MPALLSQPLSWSRNPCNQAFPGPPGPVGDPGGFPVGSAQPALVVVVEGLAVDVLVADLVDVKRDDVGVGEVVDDVEELMGVDELVGVAEVTGVEELVDTVELVDATELDDVDVREGEDVLELETDGAIVLELVLAVTGAATELLTSDEVEDEGSGVVLVDGDW